MPLRARLQDIIADGVVDDMTTDEIVDAVLEAMKDPGHDLTAGVVPVTAVRTPTINVWNGIIDNIIEGKDRG